MRTLYLAILMTALTGCAVLRPPAVEVLGAELTERTDEATRLEIHVRLRNPNDEALEILQYDYRVEVDGAPDYLGRRAGMTTMGPGSTTEAMLPAVIVGRTTGNVGGWRVGGWRVGGTVQYLTPGALADILFDTGVRRPKARFSGRGTATGE